MTLSHPTCYVFNSNAIGDIAAALPVLKYYIETYHKDGKYKVLGLMTFRDLFFFVPDDKFYDMKKPVQYEEPYLQVKLNLLAADLYATILLPNNQPIQTPVVNQHVTPLRMHLQQYAAIQLGNRVLPFMDYLRYPLDEREISGFDIDFSKCVAINPIYRSATRAFEPGELRKICDHIKGRGYIPLFLGSDKTDYEDKEKAAHAVEFDRSIGVDLVNKTTIKQAVNIIAKCAAMVGIDNGLIHLAAMTDVPIVAGYTMASPELRLPIRHGEVGWGVHQVIADGACVFCQDRWQVDNYDFTNCYHKTNECTKSMTANKFNAKLDEVFDAVQGTDM